jgi:hypothetical protein
MERLGLDCKRCIAGLVHPQSVHTGWEQADWPAAVPASRLARRFQIAFPFNRCLIYSWSSSSFMSFNDKSVMLMKAAGKPRGLLSGHELALAATRP